MNPLKIPSTKPSSVTEGISMKEKKLHYNREVAPSDPTLQYPETETPPHFHHRPQTVSTASHDDLKEKASIHLDLHLTNSFLQCLNLNVNLNIYPREVSKSMKGVTRQ
ncbi:unnamed protein product [Brassica rapa]|uniref:Uncharacterized protein n=1 Tax=Brassica campestris TaxID=3711 RepID=A0A3P6B5C8_BRACM|nr:unnamed protein product [Brassica rapa]VDC91671.1 unnamed protein product [Brassica rapa]